MGIHDREYYRRGSGTSPFAAWTQTAVGVLVAVNVICWIIQVATDEGFGLGPVTDFLAARPADVFDGQVWKLVTATFAHDPDRILHLAVNMLFLFFLGRELEQIYGRRDFYILYLVSGALSVLAEVTALHFSGARATPVLGASGAVMAVVVLFTTFYPHRKVYFMLFIPAPVWLLCAVYVGQDIFGALSRNQDQVAHLAHLTGAALGLLYRLLDLRWERVRDSLRLRTRVPAGAARGRASARKARGKIIEMPRHDPGSGSVRSHEDRTLDTISLRIEELLAKIHDTGSESLTEEEWKFLRENSGRYRSV